MAFKLTIFDWDEEQIFDTEQEAEDYVDVVMSDMSAGAEVLHLSNPGDYPFSIAEDLNYEIEEI
jgi:hypothetical protein